MCASVKHKRSFSLKEANRIATSTQHLSDAGQSQTPACIILSTGRPESSGTKSIPKSPALTRRLCSTVTANAHLARRKITWQWYIIRCCAVTHKSTSSVCFYLEDFLTVLLKIATWGHFLMSPPKITTNVSDTSSTCSVKVEWCGDSECWLVRGHELKSTGPAGMKSECHRYPAVKAPPSWPPPWCPWAKPLTSIVPAERLSGHRWCLYPMWNWVWTVRPWKRGK